MKNNNNILEALGLINNPSNMSMPNAKNMGLPTNMSIPNDPRYNSTSLNVDPSLNVDLSLMQEVQEMLANEGYNNIPSLNEDDYNENPDLNQEIKEYENNDESSGLSIVDALNLKPSSLPQNKEYSFEGGIEKALSRIKDIRSQLNTNTNNIDPTLTDEQSGIALRRAMGAAHQADMAKPWRSSGTRGFINDLSNMMIQGLGGYDTSKQQMLKENEEKEKYKLALQMQQDAIARAIEKELYSREYDKEKLGIERDNSELAKIRAESMLRNSETNKKRFELNEQKWNKENPNYSNPENNREGYDIKDMGTYVRINDVDIPKMTKQTENLVAKKKIAAADSYHEIEKIKTKIEEFEKKYGLTEETNPIYNNINRATFNLQDFVANIPYLGLDERAELIADYKDISSLVAKLDTVIEKSLGAALGVGMYDRYQRDGVAPNLKKDYGKTFLKKFDSLYKEIKETYDVLDFASVKKLNVDKKQLEKILENQQKRPQKAKEKEATIEENTANPLATNQELSREEMIKMYGVKE